MKERRTTKIEDLQSYLAKIKQGGTLKIPGGKYKLNLEELSRVCDSIETNSIKSVNISGQKLGQDGARILAKMLSTNQSVTTLTIKSCQLGDAGITEIADILPFNSTLKQMNIQSNTVSPDGLTTFFSQIRFNYSLQTIIHQSKNQEKKGTNKKFKLVQTQTEDEAIARVAGNYLIEEFIKGNKLTDAQDKKFSELLLRTDKDLLVKFLSSLDDSTKMKSLIEMVDEYLPLREKDLADSVRVMEMLEGYLEDAEYDISSRVSKANIEEVLAKISEGNDRISTEEEKAIILVGKTGAGKTTLSAAMSGIGLQAIEDKDRGKLVVTIDGKDRAPEIGHSKASMTSIPNKSVTKDGVAVWDCPGYADTTVAQEVANAFHIKKLFNHKEVKFVLVASYESIDAGRGTSFIDVLHEFCAGFKYANKLVGSLTLVVTRTDPRTKIEHIQFQLQEFIDQNKTLTTVEKAVLGNLKENVYLFDKPQSEGMIETPEFLSKIAKATEYIDVKQLGEISLSDYAVEYCQEIYDDSFKNLTKLFKALETTCSHPMSIFGNGSSNKFLDLASKLDKWLPENARDNIHDGVLLHSKDEYFLTLRLLSELRLVSSKVLGDLENDEIDIITAAVNIASVYKEFMVGKQGPSLMAVMDKYIYAIKQMGNYCQTFKDLIEIDSSSSDLEGLFKKIENCCDAISKNLNEAIIHYDLQDGAVHSREYYEEGIGYFIQIKHDKCTKNLASAYKKLGDIYASEDNYSEAIKHYDISLNYDHKNVGVNDSIGKMLLKQGKFKVAIDAFMVKGNKLMIEQCFAKLIEQDPTNYKLYELKGDKYAKLGLLANANSAYADAISLVEDVHTIALLKTKQAKMLDPNTKIAKSNEIAESVQSGSIFDFEAYTPGFFVDDSDLIGSDSDSDGY